jgi:hypothetical protein
MWKWLHRILGSKQHPDTAPRRRRSDRATTPPSRVKSVGPGGNEAPMSPRARTDDGDLAVSMFAGPGSLLVGAAAGDSINGALLGAALHEQASQSASRSADACSESVASDRPRESASSNCSDWSSSSDSNGASSFGSSD